MSVADWIEDQAPKGRYTFSKEDVESKDGPWKPLGPEDILTL